MTLTPVKKPVRKAPKKPLENKDGTSSKIAAIGQVLIGILSLFFPRK